MAFVMPRSILTADQHQNLIQRKYSAKFRLLGYWDLIDVKPLFNVPACVLFAAQSALQGTSREAIAAQLWSARLTTRDLPWDNVSKEFTMTHSKARVIWMGARSALSIEEGASSETRSSVYAKYFRQGATIVPRNFFFVSVSDLGQTVDPDRVYHAKTNEKSALDSKRPWQEVRLNGNVEGRFLFTTAIAHHVLPFCLLTPSPIVLPLEEANGKYYCLTSQLLKRKGYREFAKWMETADAIWSAKRSGKTSHSLLEWLDYSGKLTVQSPLQRHLVLYNAAGTNVSATYCDRSALTLPFVVDTTLYWAAVQRPEEAQYLVAILNSTIVNLAIKPFQSNGLMGQRHIHKKLLDLPIPRYDPEKGIHRDLSQLGTDAHRQATRFANDPVFPTATSLARQRGFIRTALGGLLTEIDILVKVLLGL